MQNTRFDRHQSPKFNSDAERRQYDRNRQDYLAFRANWKRGYKAVTTAIREAREYIREHKTSHSLTSEARSDLIKFRVMARSMMLGLEALKIQKDYDNKRNVSRLEPRIPVAMKKREMYKPSEEEIEQRRQEKRELLASGKISRG